jgi:hypothetical protein
MAGPTLDDAIAVLARQAGTTPETAVVAEFLVDTNSSWGPMSVPRACQFKDDPKVIEEAASLLRLLAQIEGMAARMKRPPFRNPARPSARAA